MWSLHSLACLILPEDWRRGCNSCSFLSVSFTSRLAQNLLEDPVLATWRGCTNHSLCVRLPVTMSDAIGPAVRVDFRRLYPANAKTPTCCPSDDNRTKVTNSVTSARSLWWHVGPYFWPADLTRTANPICTCVSPSWRQMRCGTCYPCSIFKKWLYSWAMSLTCLLKGSVI